MEKSVSVVESLAARTRTGLSEDTIARVAWGCIAAPGDIEIGALVRERGAAEALQNVLDESVPSLDGIDLSPIRARLAPRTAAPVRVCLERAQSHGFLTLSPLDPEWPARVDDLGDTAPLLLWISGQVSDLSRESVALVGATDLTRWGERGAFVLAAGSFARGWCGVTSLDAGVGDCVRRSAGALGGASLTVTARGLDQVDPAVRGTLVTEYPIGSRQTGWKELRSFQLIAALSTKAVIIEPETASPVLRVADQARRLSRPVGVIPPVVAARGTDRFARWFGARTVHTFADLLAL